MEIRNIRFLCVYSGDELDVYGVHPQYVVATVDFFLADHKVDRNELMGLAANIVEANLGDISPDFILAESPGWTPQYKGRWHQFWLREANSGFKHK